MKIKHSLYIFSLVMLLGMLLVIAPACGDDKDEDVDDGVGTADVSVFAPGDKIQLDFTEAGEEYAILPYYIEEADNSMAYSLAEGEAEVAESGEGEGEGEGEKEAKLAKVSVKPEWMSDAKWDRWQKKLAWDKKLHALGQEIARNKTYIDVRALQHELSLKHSKLMEGECTLSSDCSETEVCNQGTCSTEVALKFMDFDSSVSDITVAVKKRGTHAALLVDVNDEISELEANEVIEKFDSVIFERDQSLFGSTKVGDTDFADVNGDGINWIVMSSKVNDSGAVGMFNPADFTEDHNGADILWVVVPDDDNSMDSIFGTAAHEYFHLMIYSQKVVRHEGENETLFLNESLAHNAEEASGFGIDNIDTTYALMTDWDGMTWAFSGDDIEARAMGFMFVRFIYEQLGSAEYNAENASVVDKGGAAFLTKLATSDKLGFDNIKDALGAKSWKDYWPDFLAAIALDGIETFGNDPKYSWKEIYADPVTGQEIGICTHCTRTNASGSAVEFIGPEEPAEYEADMEGEVNATGFGFITVANQEEAIAIETMIEDEESAADFGFVVVRTK